jgi:hypothetical protein
LLERDSHPLEYATLPGRTERFTLTLCLACRYS